MHYEIDVEALFLPCYHHLLEPNDIDIEFIWGGRDSGKSEVVGQISDFEAVADKNYRCILIKKTAESVKDSQWQTLKDLAEQYEIDHHFTFRKSPLEIELDNGAMFIARGCDDPKKLKSIRNPKSAWIEEGDQLTQDDFTLIITTLRSNFGKIKIYFVFNPELPKGVTDKKDFWLYKNWFSHTTEKSFINKKVYQTASGPVEIKYRSTHTTYKDNHYVSDTRKAFLEDLKNSNPSKYGPYTLGEWGTYSNMMPAFHSYSDTKHSTFEPYSVNQTYFFDISFDFNIAPCAAVIGQVNRHTLKHHVFDVILGDPTTIQGLSALGAVCSQIYEKYIKTGKVITRRIRVTGDPSGKDGSADRQEAQTFYSTIMRFLKISEDQIFVRPGHITHVTSLDTCNEVLYRLPHGWFVLHDVPELIADIKKSFPDKDKSLWEAKKKFGLHILDAWRYLIDFWFANINGDWENNSDEIVNNVISITRRIEAIKKAA